MLNPTHFILTSGLLCFSLSLGCQHRDEELSGSAAEKSKASVLNSQDGDTTAQGVISSQELESYYEELALNTENIEADAQSVEAQDEASQPIGRKQKRQQRYQMILEQLDPELQERFAASHSKLKAWREAGRQLCEQNTELRRALRGDLDGIRDDTDLSKEEKKIKAKELFAGHKEALKVEREAFKACVEEYSDELEALKQQRRSLRDACLLDGPRMKAKSKGRGLNKHSGVKKGSKKRQRGEKLSEARQGALEQKLSSAACEQVLAGQ